MQFYSVARLLGRLVSLERASSKTTPATRSLLVLCLSLKLDDSRLATNFYTTQASGCTRKPFAIIRAAAAAAMQWLWALNLAIRHSRSKQLIRLDGLNRLLARSATGLNKHTHTHNRFHSVRPSIY